ncbi:hypothetical protein FNV43_RR13278 [Rhamnella rubrinervis]|uniref:Protein kinase domain-containing protein n=1 Tax=Rhamnella rubrinervis TaxID=2594499 RepID=A0A8K0H0V4_9ROSA|nr:hypothetical protein FNV43_RR13278 [Rhamnella rubrinervis]
MEWTRGRTLGNGSSATVTSPTLAIPASSSPSSRRSGPNPSACREQSILSSLSSPYVVSYVGEDVTFENDKLMYNLFMEYVPGGTLPDTVRRHGGLLDESLIGYYTRQVVRGLEYLHSRGLVHCDIKGTNILVGEDGPKIADFGCARRVDTVETETAVIGGTPMYMAPEVARGEEQGFACDIWALGCTVIEMATGCSPWRNQAKDFLGKCLKRNPKQRWTANQLLKHPFLEEFNSRNSKPIQEFNANSPTSILDQCIWDSLVEESESLGNLGGVITCSENSPVDRIKRLAAISEVPDWSWDQSWITIRENHNDGDGEVEEIGGSGTASVSYDKQQLEIEALVGNEELVKFLDRNISDSSCKDRREEECNRPRSV